MVLDTSVIIAIHLREPGYQELAGAIQEAPAVFIGSPTVFETAMVLSSRLGIDARPLLRNFLRQVRAEIIAFRSDHWEIATAAFLIYGRGRHPAGLNFGDCQSYAIAKATGLPLLYKGNDFGLTDIAGPFPGSSRTV